MSDQTGLDLSAELALSIGRLDDSTKRLAKFLDARRGATPADLRLSASAAYPASGTLVLNLGSPDQGTVWILRRLVVGGVTPGTAAAGAADVYVGAVANISGQNPGSLELVDWVDRASSLPLVGWYGDRQVVVKAEEILWLNITAGTAAQLYVAAAQVQQVQEAAYRQSYQI